MLQHQLDVAWSLAGRDLNGVTDEEALWCPSADSWTVRQGDDGRWEADWVEPEPWPAPPTSMAWIQWHIIWWWSTVIDRSFGHGQLTRQAVTWPGSAQAMASIGELRQRWLNHLDALTDADLAGNELTRWPYTDGRPFAFVADWVNVELTKNVAELCLLRRLTPFDADGSAI